MLNKTQQGDVYINPPHWIGDKCLFIQTLRSNTVRAVTASETLQVDKTLLEQCCEEFEDVKTKYQLFRQEIIDNGVEMLRCPICQDIGHVAENCTQRDVNTKIEQARSVPMALLSLVPTLTKK